LARPYSPLDVTQALDEVTRLLVCEALCDLVCRLPCKLAYIIVVRYGLTGEPPQPWPVIAEGLRVTRQRVQQLHTEAILWLAHPAYSLQVRQLVDRNTVTDYQAYHARLRAWQCASRRKR
jgi:DNA-directed RNA polymerase sigma subunit (sigma70/sigma32)